MTKLFTLALACLLFTSTTRSQTADLVFFTDDGAKFTLILDGEVKNPLPASRVVATGIRNETPMCVVRFEDKSMADLKQSLWFPAGKEYTIMVTTSKKGLRVFRQQGEASLGTAASAEPVKPRPATFEDDVPVSSSQTSETRSTVTQSVAAGGVQQTTSVTVVEEEEGDGSGENVNFNMDVNGVGINMNVGVTEGGTGTSTTTTRTTTTRTTTTTDPAEPVVIERVVPVSEPYRMPGYSGPIGCSMPMNSSEFADAKKSIESKGFEETKMTMAQQIGRDRCFSTEQVKGIMGLFGFEETKLEFAKFAYDRTHDIGNFYRVNDAFGFESSIEELNDYIKSR